MGKGKIGAQCAHAAVGILGRYRGRHEAVFRQWEASGQPKIALKVKDEEAMADLAERAQQCGLMCYIVRDAGRTQIAAGSQTVLAIGPAPKSRVDQVTGHLPLM
ncbi:peptidyl-tRNA hydrolase, PTH2 family [Monoraphidium neglectum]|uniref:peptidyl-tRNA hydrolase n=1 Tax=Monoraphidium neglectum TaxID=145388 RepID=A0A0D2NE91_9CHLO|nr:peptidyl-tRNA hydrolase, PTH2 family [Monoraphidium neglectum]KIZ03551.1 peptidyl-tRNA hydrolase, PTH2 family [Monoraphidium neglectum]|eukprot:XP_013902570.1 peptidyl-tRNA hydrolase, PTH2 family [Monoraphidium neglectum]